MFIKLSKNPSVYFNFQGKKNDKSV